MVIAELNNTLGVINLLRLLSALLTAFVGTLMNYAANMRGGLAIRSRTLALILIQSARD